MWRGTTLLVALTLISKVYARSYGTDYKLTLQIQNDESPESEPYFATVSDEEYIRHIHSMFDTDRSGLGGRVVIETNALVDTKFRTWKRNADLINSLLALPKGMNDAGR